MIESKIRVFDSLAADYDAWFEKEGRLIFASEVEALRQALPLLPKPWIEVGIGSGRFAQALGIDIGLDPSSKLLKIAQECFWVEAKRHHLRMVLSGQFSLLLPCALLIHQVEF